MAIIVNGTTIPTNGDYIKVGSTLVDKVDVVRNGVRTTVWEKIRDFYIWKDGTPYTDYYPSTFVDKSCDSFNMNFERRDGDYGLTVSNIRTSGSRNSADLICGFIIPDINVAGCSKITINCHGYLDEAKGARTWYFMIFGIKSDNSITTIMDDYYFTKPIVKDISEYQTIRIKLKIDCGMDINGDQCNGCTVGYYINSIFIEQ